MRWLFSLSWNLFSGCLSYLSLLGLPFVAKNRLCNKFCFVLIGECFILTILCFKLTKNRSGMVILNDSLSVILKPALSLNYENLCLIDKKSQKPLA